MQSKPWDPQYSLLKPLKVSKLQKHISVKCFPSSFMQHWSSVLCSPHSEHFNAHVCFVPPVVVALFALSYHIHGPIYQQMEGILVFWVSKQKTEPIFSQSRHVISFPSLRHKKHWWCIGCYGTYLHKYFVSRNVFRL